jgi:hypothetical protein
MPDGTEQLGVQYVFVAGEGNDLVAISLAAAARQAPSAATDWSSLLRSLRFGDTS